MTTVHRKKRLEAYRRELPEGMPLKPQEVDLLNRSEADADELGSILQIRALFEGELVAVC